MNCIMLSPDNRQGRAWQYELENLGESWRCTLVLHAGQALQALERWTDALILADCGESRDLLHALTASPMLAPPYILGLDWDAPDGRVHTAQDAANCLEALRQSGCLPTLSDWWRARVEAVAASLLRTMDVPPRLRAWAFLPDMAALTVTHPPLMNDLSHHLYPLIARRHGMSPAGVERSLRLCVESTWVNGSITALERFFGSSVDPEKGKPTNREFLCRVQERLTLTMRRLR